MSITFAGRALGSGQFAGRALGGVHKGSAKLWPEAAAAGIQRIAAGYAVCTSGGFDRDAQISDIGPIPAGSLVVVKIAGFDTITVHDTAGNTYVAGTDGRTGWRMPTFECHCLSTKASEVNAFDFNIELGGGGVAAYMIAVEAYTGPGVWAYLASESGVTQQSYATGNAVNSNPFTTTSAGVATGIVGNDNDPGPFAQFTPGQVIISRGMQNQADADAMSGEFIFDEPATDQVIAAGVGVSGAYKYLDLNLSVFVSGATP